MTVFPIFPAEIEFRFPSDLGDHCCRLAWRRSAHDGRSRNDFCWPPPGEWTPEVEADTSRIDCSFGLHAAKTWSAALNGPLFQLVAIPEAAVAHDGTTKIRFSCAAVISHLTILQMISDGRFAGADLTGANLTRADLAGANLTCAYLTYADLTGAYLTDANLTRADLTGREWLTPKKGAQQ